jgi:hypothetical protein
MVHVYMSIYIHLPHFAQVLRETSVWFSETVWRAETNFQAILKERGFPKPILPKYLDPKTPPGPRHFAVNSWPDPPIGYFHTERCGKPIENPMVSLGK